MAAAVEDSTAFDHQFDAAVEAALDDLGPQFRAAVELVDIRGLTYAEAAQHLQIPVGTVMSRLHRGLPTHARPAGTGRPRPPGANDEAVPT
ncbi:MAG: sigma factor-like helix-turn-helix DNA-binding protein [Acidimicrobiales bacterium]